MSKPFKLIYPGDPGWIPNKSYPWSLGRLAGISQQPSVEVSGFYVIDRREEPNTAIFQNCQFKIIPGEPPLLDEVPKPFRAPAQCAEIIKKMHLPQELEQRCLKGKGPVSIVAWCPDPGLGYPKPDVMIMDKEAFNSW